MKFLFHIAFDIVVSVGETYQNNFGDFVAAPNVLDFDLLLMITLLLCLVRGGFHQLDARPYWFSR